MGEILHACIIRPTASPHSLVILVKKKNGEWRFCVDHRALNKLTTLTNFLNGEWRFCVDHRALNKLTILTNFLNDELLDELGL